MNMKSFPMRRFIVMMAGLLVMSFGVTLFKFSLTGNDPCNAFFLAFSQLTGINYSVTGLGLNVFLFVFEILLYRKHIGIGTFANWFCVAPVADLMMRTLSPLFPDAVSFEVKLVYLAVGIVVLSLSVSMYQSADLGIAPYDSIALILEERTKLPYFFARILIDALFSLIAFLCGGLIGLGTLVCVLGLGPIIAFFDKHVTNHMLGTAGGKKC